MKKRTLYVSDMDGTLLNSHSVLSEATVEMLNDLICNRKVLFTVATARTPATVVPLMSRVQATLPFITMAGAALWDNQTLQYQAVRAIPQEAIRRLIPFFANQGINPFVYRRHGNCIHAHHVRHFTPGEQQFIRQRVATQFKQLIACDIPEADNPDEAMLIFALGNFGTLQSIANQLKDAEIPCSLVCYHDIFDTTQGILEVYAEGTTKAHAVTQMAQQLKAERIVVFGDNLNDLPMMQVATHSLAVENAFDEVKQQAHEIIGTNDEDAVPKWIIADLLRS